MKRLHLTLFVMLLAFWFALSGRFTPLFVGMGVASAALVTWVMGPLVASTLGAGRYPLARQPLRVWYALTYLGWLAGSVLASGLQVAWIVINPRVPPEPRMLRFRTNLESRFARVMLANTISLVPGTMTVTLEDDEYWVHALVPSAVDNLLDGRMQTRIARMFFAEPERAIDPRWEDPPEVRS